MIRSKCPNSLDENVLIEISVSRIKRNIFLTSGIWKLTVQAMKIRKRQSQGKYSSFSHITYRLRHNNKSDGLKGLLSIVANKAVEL